MKILAELCCFYKLKLRSLRKNLVRAQSRFICSNSLLDKKQMAFFALPVEEMLMCLLAMREQVSPTLSHLQKSLTAT